jgi:hypothetical protein
MSPVFRKPPAKKPVVKKPVAKKPVVKRPGTTTAARKDAGLMPPVAKKPLPKPAPKPFPKAPPAAKPGMAKPPMPRPGQPAKPPIGVPPYVAREATGHIPMLRTGLEGKTNQDIINVIYKAAEELKIPGWTLLAKLKLEHLVDARTAPYSGPTLASLPDLTNDQKAVILKVLASYVPPKK